MFEKLEIALTILFGLGWLRNFCPQCNLSIGRDLNAAINIKKAAQVLLKDSLPPFR
ncbi:MAG: hypothetical protein F6K48_20580 [Okeania sp. SIO3H1]|nr:hypothetical protein [Okeania sp. SIO3H1]